MAEDGAESEGIFLLPLSLLFPLFLSFVEIADSSFSFLIAISAGTAGNVCIMFSNEEKKLRDYGLSFGSMLALR